MICCTRIHKTFKVRGLCTSCVDRPAPSKGNAITERSSRPLILLKKTEGDNTAQKIHVHTFSKQ